MRKRETNINGWRIIGLNLIPKLPKYLVTSVNWTWNGSVAHKSGKRAHAHDEAQNVQQTQQHQIPEVSTENKTDSEGEAITAKERERLGSEPASAMGNASVTTRRRRRTRWVAAAVATLATITAASSARGSGICILLVVVGLRFHVFVRGHASLHYTHSLCCICFMREGLKKWPVCSDLGRFFNGQQWRKRERDTERGGLACSYEDGVRSLFVLPVIFYHP